MRRPRHIRQVLGAGVHPRGGQHPRCQRGGPQHVWGPGPRDRVGLPPRGTKQGQPRQYPPCFHHLGRPKPHRGPRHPPHQPRKVLVYVRGARMILGLSEDPHNT